MFHIDNVRKDIIGGKGQMLYRLYTQDCDGFGTCYVHNARIVSASDEKEATSIYKQNMKNQIGRKKIHIQEFELPHGYIGIINIDGKDIPSKREQ